MLVKRNFDLYSFNTMRLHSLADIVYFPENRQELADLLVGFKHKRIFYNVFSGGSNIIFAERVKSPLIHLMSLDNNIDYLPEGLVKVGCSVRIQTLIRDMQKRNLGGIEYLFSVPTSTGGAVYMNAGRGKREGLSISDYLESVEYFSPVDEQFHLYYINSEDFSYRHSPFQETDFIIVSATFRFKNQDSIVTDQLIHQRLDHSKKYLSADKPSCGSVFCEGNRLVYRFLMGQKVGGAMYSKKTPNWITNMGDATASDVMTLIDKGKKLHKLFFSRFKVEIRYIS